MKLVIFPLLALVSFSSGAPGKLRTNDLSVVNYNMKRVTDALNILDNQLTRRPAYDQAQITQFFQIGLQASQQVTNELYAGAAEIRRGPNINDIESIGLNAPTQALQNLLTKVMGHWVAVKRQANQVGAQSAVLDALVQGASGAMAFGDAIYSKCGFLCQGVVNGYKNQFATIHQNAINEYRKPDNGFWF
jgi:hypothetical protein